MKKLLVAILLLGLVITFGSSKAYAFDITGLASFGSLVSLPISGPTTINVMNGATLKTRGSVDFAVLYDGSLYSYFYQVTNLGGGLNDTLGRYTFVNPFSFPALGSGIIADALDPVTLRTSSLSSYGVDFNLGVGETTDRFYFQFSAPPTVTNGFLIDGGIGTGDVVGPAPEPASMMLLGMGILGLFGLKKRS